MFRSLRLITAFVLVLVATAPATAQSAEQLAADARRVIEALDIRSGSVVAEIGAGDGALTLRIAEAVGTTGRVFSNELGPRPRGDDPRERRSGGAPCSCVRFAVRAVVALGCPAAIR